MSNKLVIIVWYSHARRAETMAAELDGQVSFQYKIGLKGLWLTPLRYLVQGWKTWRLLEREQPEAVIVQAPPVFAPLIVAVWCELRDKTRSSRQRVPYAIDCHTATFERKWRWALPLLRLLSRRAAVTLVASEAALGILQRWKARALFLVDGLPTLSPPVGTIGSEGEARVAVIGNLDTTDEPVAEVFAAARLLPQVTFYLTGNWKRLEVKLLAQKPENVILTGFLPESIYSGLLKNVHGLIVLTKRSNVLNCGAYEALVVEKPTVVSDWPQIRHYFRRGFIYVNNTPGAIAAGVKKMLDEQAMLTAEVIAMREELATRRQPDFEKFVALLKS